MGIEPTTSSLGSLHSTAELRPQSLYFFLQLNIKVKSNFTLKKNTKYILRVLAGFLIFSIVLVLLSPFWFPGKKITGYLEKELGKAFGSKVMIGWVKLSFFSGVVANEVKIYKTGETKPFLSCDAINVFFNIFLLREKRIHSVSLINPKISLMEYPDGSWNYPAFKGEVFDGVIGKISLKRGTLEVSVPGFSEKAESVDFTLNPYGRGLKSNFSFKVFLPGMESAADGDGEISFLKDRTDISFKINVSSLPFRYLPQGLKNYLIPHNGVIPGKLFLSGSINWSNEIYQARVNSKIRSLRLKTAKGMVIPIDADVYGEGAYSREEKKVLSLNLRAGGIQLSAFQNFLGNEIISGLQGTCQANFIASGEMIHSELGINDFAGKVKLGKSLLDFTKDEISFKAKAEYNKKTGNIKVRSLSMAIERLGKFTAGGDISGVTGSLPKLDLKFTISPIRLSEIRDFLTEKKLFILKEFQTEGISEASGAVSGTVKEPMIRGMIKIADGEISSKIIKVSDISSSIPFHAAGESIEINPLEFSCGSIATGSPEEKKILRKGAKLSSDLSYNYRDGTLAGENFSFKIPALGQINGSFLANLTEMKLVEGKIKSLPISLEKSREELKAFLPSYLNEIKMYGDIGIYSELGDINLKDPLLKPQIFSRISLNNAGFESEDSSKALNGLKGDISLKIFPGDLRRNLAGEVKAKLSGFEFLINQFYASFKGREIELNFNPDYWKEKSELFLEYGNLVLPEAAAIGFSGKINTSKEILTGNISSKYINNKNLIELIKASLKENYPFLSRVGCEGESWIEVALNSDFRKTDLTGKVKIKSTDISVKDEGFSLKGLNGDLPFSLVYPSEKNLPAAKMNFDESMAGMIGFKELSFGTVKLINQSYNVLVKDNSLAVKDDIEIPLFKGRFDVKGVRIADIFNPSEKIQCSLHLDNIDLAEASGNYKRGKINGKVSGLLDAVSVADGNLKAQGEIRADLFGGTVVLRDLKGEDIFSYLRTLGFSSDFRDINLEQATRSLGVGLMTGILEGSAKDVVIFDGLPTSFELDLETVPRKGISQVVSTDALRNMSILGSGLAGVFERGVSNYQYQKFWLYSRLKDDKLVLRGKIHKKGREYFLYGLGFTGFRLTRIEIVNTFPGETVSFKDLVDRLGRIERKRE